MLLLQRTGRQPIVFSRFPKAASTWLYQACKLLKGIEPVMGVEAHIIPAHAHPHLEDLGVDPARALYVATYRDPLEWLNSFFHQSNVWGGFHPGPTHALWPVQEMPYPEWISWLRRCRKGVLGSIYASYLPPGMSVRLAVESLPRSFIAFCEAHGLEGDYDAIRSMGTVNASPEYRKYLVADRDSSAIRGEVTKALRLL